MTDARWLSDLFEHACTSCLMTAHWPDSHMQEIGLGILIANLFMQKSRGEGTFRFEDWR
jgi:hypothetical protein